jgi:hypothetical protein
MRVGFRMQMGTRKSGIGGIASFCTRQPPTILRVIHTPMIQPGLSKEPLPYNDEFYLGLNNFFKRTEQK